MQNQKQNLINIISRCNSKQVRQQWIREFLSYITRLFRDLRYKYGQNR